MTETFNHLFGGWKSAKARRWRNPDGGDGGIVAVDARLDQSLVVPSDVVIWPGARGDEMSTMTLEQLEVSFEQWHNKVYGNVGVRSLERWPEETGLGYVDTAVQAQFFLYCELMRAHAQMVEKVREVIADIEGSRGDEEDLYWFGRWSDQLRHAIGDKP